MPDMTGKALIYSWPSIPDDLDIANVRQPRRLLMKTAIKRLSEGSGLRRMNDQADMLRKIVNMKTEIKKLAFRCKLRKSQSHNCYQW